MDSEFAGRDPIKACSSRAVPTPELPVGNATDGGAHVDIIGRGRTGRRGLPGRATAGGVEIAAALLSAMQSRGPAKGNQALRELFRPGLMRRNSMGFHAIDRRR